MHTSHLSIPDIRLSRFMSNYAIQSPVKRRITHRDINQCLGSIGPGKSPTRPFCLLTFQSEKDNAVFVWAKAMKGRVIVPFGNLRPSLWDMTNQLILPMDALNDLIFTGGILVQIHVAMLRS
jgi:hypothetical protein